MTPASQRWNDSELNTYAVATASAAAGCALGMLFGRGMSRKSSNIASVALLATGALLVAPTVSRLANRPSSARGSRKRLESIRNGAVPEGADIYPLGDEN
jgi:hypothetical protein